MKVKLVPNSSTGSDDLRQALIDAGFVVLVDRRSAAAAGYDSPREADACVLDARDGANGEWISRAKRADAPHVPLVLVGDAQSAATFSQLLNRNRIDGYVVEPLKSHSVAKLVRSLARGVRTPSSHENQLTLGPLELSSTELEAYWNGQPLNLRPAEFKVLLRLATSSGEAVERAALAGVLSRTQVVGPRAVDQVIWRLRRRLSDHRDDIQVKSVKGVGYSLTTRGSR